MKAPSAPEKTNPLEDVPKPAHINPGGIAPSLEDISSRVAMIRGEFRGLPEEQKGDDTEEASPPAKRPRRAQAAKTEPRAKEVGEKEEKRPRRSRKAPKSEPVEAVDAGPADAEASDGRPELAPNECRIFVNVGRRDSVDASGLRETIAELGGLMPDDILDVDVCGRYSFLTIDNEFADDVLEAVNGERIGRRTLRLERAKER